MNRGEGKKKNLQAKNFPHYLLLFSLSFMTLCPRFFWHVLISSGTLSVGKWIKKVYRMHNKAVHFYLVASVHNQSFLCIKISSQSKLIHKLFPIFCGKNIIIDWMKKENQFSVPLGIKGKIWQKMDPKICFHLSFFISQSENLII